MKLDRFLVERQPSWKELERLVAAARGRPERLGATRLRRLGALYRGVAADVALARRRFPMDPLVPALEDLVGRARHLIYDSDARRESVLHFASRGYWRRVRERPSFLAVSAALLFVPLVLATLWGLDDPLAARDFVPAALAGAAEPQLEGADLSLPVDVRAGLSAQIFTNNIRVALLAFAGGISAGLLTAAALSFNGAVIGAITGLAVGAGAGASFLQLVVPHGVLELSCITVAGASGLRLAWAIVVPGRRGRVEALVAEARPAVEVALGTAAWLVVAGLVEGFVTPTAIGVGPAIAGGVGLAALYWALVWWRGAPAEATSSVPPTAGPGPCS